MNHKKQFKKLKLLIAFIAIIVFFYCFPWLLFMFGDKAYVVTYSINNNKNLTVDDVVKITKNYADTNKFQFKTVNYGKPELYGETIIISNNRMDIALLYSGTRTLAQLRAKENLEPTIYNVIISNKMYLPTINRKYVKNIADDFTNILVKKPNISIIDYKYILYSYPKDRKLKDYETVVNYWNY